MNGSNPKERIVCSGVTPWAHREQEKSNNHQGTCCRDLLLTSWWRTCRLVGLGLPELGLPKWDLRWLLGQESGHESRNNMLEESGQESRYDLWEQLG